MKSIKQLKKSVKCPPNALFNIWMLVLQRSSQHVLIAVFSPSFTALLPSWSKPEGLWLIDLSTNSSWSSWEDKTFVTFASLSLLQKNEDYLTGRCRMCHLSWPLCGCFVFVWAEDRDRRWRGSWGRDKRREAAQKSEKRLDVEPVFPAGRVHRQRLPVHWQGKSCVTASQCLLPLITEMVPYGIT